jgi:hypothetical protein
MEEKKQNKKLSYEELEAYANQTVTQAQQVYKENQQLVEEVRNLRAQMNYADINLAFKALELKENFSKEFINKVVTKLEEILTPRERPKEEKKEVGPKEG